MFWGNWNYMEGYLSNKRKVLVILVAVVMSTIIGNIVFSNSPTQRLKKQLDLGQKYLNELEYEQAVAAFKQALLIDPENGDVLVLLVDSYIEWIDACTATGDYDTARMLAEELREYNENKYSETVKKIDAAEEEYQKKLIYDKLKDYSDLFDMVCNYAKTISPDSFANNGPGYCPDGGSTCHRTYAEKKETIDPIIDKLQRYIILVLDNKDYFPQLLEHADIVYVEIEGGKYFKINTAFFALEDMYCAVGDMEGLDNALALHETFNNYHPEDSSHDKYGRFLSDDTQYVKKMEWGIGYENTYSYCSENGHETTETKEYEEGRLKKRIEKRSYENSSWIVTWSYEYSGNILTLTRVEDHYYKGKLYQSDKAVNEYNIDQYGGAHEIRSTSYDSKGNPSLSTEYEYDSEGRKIGEKTINSDGSLEGSIVWIMDEDGKLVKSILYDAEGAVIQESDYSD